MASTGFGSMHRRRSSAEPSSFFEKVQLDFQLPDLLVQLSLLLVGLLAHLFAAVGEHVGQALDRLAFPKADLGRVDAKGLGDLRGGFLAFDRLDGHLGLQARRMILSGLRHSFSLFSNAAPPSKKGALFCPKNGVHHRLRMKASAASRCASSVLNSCSRPSSVDLRV